MIINETTNFNGNVLLKDANDVEVVVAYLSGSLDGGSQNLAINMNVTNKALLTTVNAFNVAGESPKVQYAAFEAAVKARAIDLGYAIF